MTAYEESRQRTYARLTEQEDPLLREIGDQLGQGVLRPSDLLTDPSYRGLLARSLRRLQTAALAVPDDGTENIPGGPAPATPLPAPPREDGPPAGPSPWGTR
ncbi:hypothetical protein [Rhizomonospora bruguierae]|uniref:hypothetical protein n=1 Tax=Rhizomonospora bruguierae TaxID=1581705 RepID=UPI001BCBE501|nr:hypothetical protein [Micromonospora sp. NBRC 107566]